MKTRLTPVLALVAALAVVTVAAFGQGSVRSYATPYCGPSGGSTPWACGPWPTTVPPALGPANTFTVDPDTGNRVLRISQSGSFGEAAGTAFKAYDAGWKQAFNANSTRIMVIPWGSGAVNHTNYWVNFDPATMAVSAPAGNWIPWQFIDTEWDQNDPDLVVGLYGDTVNPVHLASYNVVTGVTTHIFDPNSINWGGSNPWLSAWGGDLGCIVGGGQQDAGKRFACHNRKTGQSYVVNLINSTINSVPMPVYFKGQPITLPADVGIHTITVGRDGKWVAIDTHGNTMCSTPGLSNYGSTALFVNLETGMGYEWNNACGGTHWAYGHDGAMIQSGSPKWTSYSNNSPCNSDSRGFIHRVTDLTVDSGLYQLAPCSFYEPLTWNVNIHLSWLNNFPDFDTNNYPVLVSAVKDGASNMFLFNEIAAMETSAAPYSGKLWRFAQTWNDAKANQCYFLDYSSPSVSPDGRWAIFPSNWAGQTGNNGPCTNNQRTDLFLFELRAAAADVTSQVRVSRSGYGYQNSTLRFYQTITITNTSAQTLNGPFSIAMDGLPNGVSLYQPAGVTQYAEPVGSPYVIIPSPTSLVPGASAKINVQFVDPAKVSISYRPRILAGNEAK